VTGALTAKLLVKPDSVMARSRNKKTKTEIEFGLKLNMSARMEVETVRWDTLEPVTKQEAGKLLSEVEVESFFRNFDQRDLVAPLREVHEALSQAVPRTADAEDATRAALAVQARWDAYLVRREQLKAEIKRGREYLEINQNDLGALRAGLENWAAYEEICGKNPLCEYMQSIFAREQIAQFLPAWLNRREEQLEALVREMELCAKQNGLEHLL
jgi:hypothetical protein